jgi:methylenetetrahydrofolate dehydrogenase (NADP+)/methenyltetrahydrofolate cyclohydrolase
MSDPNAETETRRLDGKMTSKRIRGRIASVLEERPEGSPSPYLHLVRVGEDPASVVYVRNKAKMCRKVGIRSSVHELSEEVRQEDVLALLQDLNQDDDVDGILVQLPLPPRLDAGSLQEAIDPAKDVDGLHPLNAGRLAQGQLFLIPCTPLGVLTLLRDHGIDPSGKRVVILGRSDIVGRPLAQLLSLKGVDATVTVAHSRTPSIAEVTREAEILVAAVGVPRFVDASMVRPGAVVVDVGMHRLEEPGAERALLVGDVDADAVAPLASALSPVPGGVGPMTVVFLLANTLWAAQMRREWPQRTPPWDLWKASREGTEG